MLCFTRRSKYTTLAVTGCISFEVIGICYRPYAYGTAPHGQGEWNEPNWDGVRTIQVPGCWALRVGEPGISLPWDPPFGVSHVHDHVYMGTARYRRQWISRRAGTASASG